MLMPLIGESHTEAQDRERPQLGTGKGDLGSWPEPGERVTLLSVFCEGCVIHYENGGRWPCKAARAAVMMTLSDRYSYRLMRWLPAIERVLDRAEEEARDGLHQN